MPTQERKENSKICIFNLLETFQIGVGDMDLNVCSNIFWCYCGNNQSFDYKTVYYNYF